MISYFLVVFFPSLTKNVPVKLKPLIQHKVSKFKIYGFEKFRMRIFILLISQNMDYFQLNQGKRIQKTSCLN